MISMYIGGNHNTAGSFYVMAHSLKKYWAGKGVESEVLHKLGDLQGRSGVINFIVEDVAKIDELRRYIGLKNQICLFAGNTEDYNVQQLGGLALYLLKAPMVTHSPHHYDSMRNSLRIFSPSTRKSMEANLHYLPFGITDEFVDAGKNDRNLWFVPTTRWAENQKKVSLHVELLYRAKILLKKDITIRMNLWQKYFDELEKHDTSLLDIHVCPEDRSEYVETCQRTGMFISTADYESFGIMYLELMFCGAVGVFLDRPWVRKLLPGYKLIASNNNDLVGMLVTAYKGYDKAQEYVRAYLKEQCGCYSFSAFADSLQCLYAQGE